MFSFVVEILLLLVLTVIDFLCMRNALNAFIIILALFFFVIRVNFVDSSFVSSSVCFFVKEKEKLFPLLLLIA